MTKNIKSIFFVLTLVMLLVTVGAVCASDDADNTIATDTSVSDTATVSDSVSDTVAHMQTSTNEQSVTTKNKETKNNNIKENPQAKVLNSTNYNNYFTNGKLNENISEGDIIDIQGPLDHQKFNMTINKPITLTSTTGDAIIGNGYWRNELNAGNIFTVTEEAAGTNISNIYFNNTQFVLSGTHDINLNNISVATDNPGIGMGQGVTSIRWSENITVTNSFFKTKNNGGVSNLVCAVAKNVLIDNCTIIGEGSVGNLFYITTYNTGYDGEGPANVNITIQNCYINGVNATTQSICQGITIDGTNHTILNNTLLFNDGVATNQQYGDSYEGQNILINNYIPYGRSILQGWKVYNNTFNDVMVKSGTDFVNNTVMGKINITGEGSNFTGNLWKNKTVDGSVNDENNYYGNNTRVVYINDDNYDYYFENQQANTNLINFDDEYILVIYEFQEYHSQIRIKDFKNGEKIISIILNSNIGKLQYQEPYEVCLINSYVPVLNLAYGVKSSSIINSTIYRLDNEKMYGNTTLVDSYVLNRLSEGTYQLSTSLFEEGVLINSISANADLLVIDDISSDMTFNKPVNIFAPYGAPGVLSGNIILDEGASLNLTGLTLNGNLTIKTSNVNITNCTINGKVELDSVSNVLLDSNVINNQIFLVNSLENTITNNIVTTSEDNTIVLDSDSFMNVIRGNDLSASSLFNDKSIQDSGSDNVMESNGPTHSTSLSLTAPEGIYPGMDVPVTVEVRSDDTLVDNGYVVLLADGVEVDRVNLTDGVANANVKFNESNNKAIIKAYYYPTKYYESTNNWVLRNVKYTNTKVEINDVSLSKIGEEFTVTSTVKDSSDNVITEGEVIYTINDETYPVSIINGVATLTLTSNEDYYSKVLVVDFKEGNGYASSTNQTSLRFEKGDSILNITQTVNDDDTVNITVIVTDINGRKVSGGYIQFKTSTTTKTVALADATAEYIVPVPETNTTMNVTFRNNQAFEQKTEQITIESKPIFYDIRVNTTEFTAGNKSNIQAIIYANDEISNLNKGKVMFKVNGKTLKDAAGKVIYAKVVNGVATIENYLVPSDWSKEGTTIQAVYSGSTDCDKLTSEKTNITVTKSVPTFTTEDVSATVGGKITLKATITDNDKVINTGKVVFKINGKTVKDENGKVIYAKVVNNQVVLEYTLPESFKAGTYNIEAVFTASGYEKLTGNTTMTVVKS